MGPLAGTVLAVLLYKLIKALEYESANPDPEAQTAVVQTAGPTGGMLALDQVTDSNGSYIPSDKALNGRLD